MKRTLKHAALLLTLVAGTVLMGCSGSETKRSSGEYLDDQGITAKVKSALFADPNVSGFQVNVDTYDRVVSLSGFVDTPAQKSRAEEVARGVEGVRSVQNNLSVKELHREVPPGS